MEIKIVTSPIKKAEIAEIAKNQFGDLVKAAVDVEKVTEANLRIWNDISLILL